MSIVKSKVSQRVQQIATEIANNSPCLHKHGAVITRGNRIVACGCNTNKRTAFLGKQDCCMHAEMAATLQFMNNVVHKKRKKYCF